jgi:hypothetical protein
MKIGNVNVPSFSHIQAGRPQAAPKEDIAQPNSTVIPRRPPSSRIITPESPVPQVDSNNAGVGFNIEA